MNKQINVSTFFAVLFLRLLPEAHFQGKVSKIKYFSFMQYHPSRIVLKKFNCMS